MNTILAIGVFAAISRELGIPLRFPGAEGHLARFFRSGRAAPYLLLLPAVVIILGVVAVPLLVSLWSSFTPYSLIRPATLYRFRRRRPMTVEIV